MSPSEAVGDDERQEVVHVFTDLARLVHARPGLHEVCQAVADAATRLVEGCDHASIMVREGRTYRTVAGSDDVAFVVDRLERETGSGPCVDAIETDGFQRDDDIAVRSQWLVLSRRVLAETPVRGMAGYRLLVDGRKTGALNLFSDTAGALTAESADTGVLLASFASVALGGASHHAQAQTLTQGIESNREIGIAIGLMMAAHSLTAAEAFATLRKASSQLNRKVSSIAAEIVALGPAGMAP